MSGFVVDGENPLSADLTQATLRPFTGQHTGIERLQQATLALEEVLRNRGFGFYRVVLPPQDIGGEIKLQMFKFTQGTLTIKGNLALGGGNDSISANSNRSGATNNWDALRLGADVTMPLPANWVGTARFKGQLSGQPLVPGEQFGIGGAQSVRGLNERVLSGDTGWQASFKARSQVYLENTFGLVFYDTGQVRRHNDLVTPFAAASGLGFGLRWRMGNNLAANVDVAHVRSGLANLPAGTSRDKVHFALSWKY